MRHSMASNPAFSFCEFDLNDPHREETPHDDLLKLVKRTGKAEYHAYGPSDSSPGRVPMRLTTQRRADWISKVASECYGTQRNEAEWRLDLEKDVFKRFEVEVACRQCRADLWMTEAENQLASRWSTSEHDTHNQSKSSRGSCLCPVSYRDQDCSEDGLSRIFDRRAEEFVEHQASANRRRDKPDRVYGLRKAGRLAKLLDHHTHNGVPLCNAVRWSPFPSKSHRPVFPFLVLEAKSEHSAYGRSAIQRQTRDTICTLLDLQEKLVECISPSGHDLAPLVWFISNKGEHWQVAAAQTRHQDAKTFYRVETIWHGKLTVREEALQLLLIIDRIFDWARDQFRPTIIDSLRLLSDEATPSLFAETEYGENIRRMSPVEAEKPHNQPSSTPSSVPIVSPESQPRPANGREALGVSSMLQYFDVEGSTGCCFRDSSIMEYDVCAVDITLFNIEEFLECYSRDVSRDQYKARKVLRCFDSEHAWMLTGDTLDELELMWTGYAREHFYEVREPDQRFLVSLGVSSRISRRSDDLCQGQYCGSAWHPVHTLSWIAIAVDALESLQTVAARFVKELPQSPMKKQEAIDTFAKIRYASIEQSLEAALNGSVRVANYDWRRNKRGVIKDLTTSRPRATLTRPRLGVGSASLPWTVRKELVIGRRRHDKTFMRTSALLGRQFLADRAPCRWLDKPTFTRGSRALFVVDKSLSRGSTACLYMYDYALPERADAIPIINVREKTGVRRAKRPVDCLDTPRSPDEDLASALQSLSEQLDCFESRNNLTGLRYSLACTEIKARLQRLRRQKQSEQSEAELEKLLGQACQTFHLRDIIRSPKESAMASLPSPPESEAEGDCSRSPKRRKTSLKHTKEPPTSWHIRTDKGTGMPSAAA